MTGGIDDIEVDLSATMDRGLETSLWVDGESVIQVPIAEATERFEQLIRVHAPAVADALDSGDVEGAAVAVLAQLDDSTA